MLAVMDITVIASAARDRWRGSDVDSRQAFPATGNFDLSANAFGPLQIHNDDRVSPGAGFDMHHHQDAEIVTWVVEGNLRHRDSGGADVILSPGMAQAISAGSGVSHAEVNAAGYTGKSFLRVVQMWLRPDSAGTEPRHCEGDFRDLISEPNELHLIAAGDNVTDVRGQLPRPLRIGTDNSRLRYVLLEHGSVRLPLSEFTHIYLLRGSATVGSESLAEGDQARIVSSVSETVAVSGDDAELLIWSMADSPSIIDTALELAVEAHRHDSRPGAHGEEAYILHPERIAASVRNGGADEEVIAAALLHDVAEDHPYLWSLHKELLPERVVGVVEKLSRRDDETYAQFVDRAAADPDSLVVKLADVNDNLGSLDNLPRGTDEQRVRFNKLEARYQDALDTLLVKTDHTFRP